MSTKVVRFVDAYLDSPLHTRVKAYPKDPIEWELAWNSPSSFPPPRLTQGLPDEDGFITWRPIDSPITRRMTAGFERFLETPLPSFFKAYLEYKCLTCMDLLVGILPDVDPRSPLQWLEWCVKCQEAPGFQANPRYLPLCHSPTHLGLLCLDRESPDGVEDRPLFVVFNGQDDFKAAPVEVFENFDSYVDYLTRFIEFTRGDRTLHFESWLRENGYPEPPDVYFGLS